MSKIKTTFNSIGLMELSLKKKRIMLTLEHGIFILHEIFSQPFFVSGCSQWLGLWYLLAWWRIFSYRYRDIHYSLERTSHTWYFLVNNVENSKSKKQTHKTQSTNNFRMYKTSVCVCGFSQWVCLVHNLFSTDVIINPVI